VNPIRQTYPQTNIQTIGPLLLQLRDRGFDDAAILSVNRTYHLAMRLWAVNFQSSSRPFICHAVGTASSTAEHGGSLDEILAALLHAAYSSGDFGVRIPGATKRKRRQVRNIIGEEAEELVHCFHSMLNRYDSHWERILQEKGVHDLSKHERSVLFIRVCHDLEDISDLAFSSDLRQQRIANFTSGSISLAQHIGRQELADKLEAEYHKFRNLDFLPREVSQRHSSGYIVVPAAFRKRLISGMLEVAHRLWTTGSLRVNSGNVQITASRSPH
jgi:(p)ppGpp synthase/HD superfamily hydrolase